MSSTHYNGFLNENPLKFLCNKIKYYRSNSRVGICVKNVLPLLKNSKINCWEDWIKMPVFEKDIIRKVVYSCTKGRREPIEVRFLVRLKISNKLELIDYLKDLEKDEKYEKCLKVVKKINRL